MEETEENKLVEDDKPTNKEENVAEDLDIKLLIENYKLLLDGYKYRDQITPGEFKTVIQAFSALFALLIGFNIFSDLAIPIHICYSFFLGIIGFMIMFAILISIQSKTSCKNALREEASIIERVLQEKGIEFNTWKKIKDRKKYKLEKRYKTIIQKDEKKKKGEKEHTTGNLYSMTTFYIILLWVMCFISVIFYDIICLLKA